MTVIPYKSFVTQNADGSTNTPFSLGDLISDDVANQIVSNIQYLKDSVPTSRYTNTGSENKSQLETAVMYVGGKVKIPRKRHSDRTKVLIHFPAGAFSEKYKPHVVATINCSRQRRVFVTIGGIKQPYPTSRGFTAHIMIGESDAKLDKLNQDMYLHYIAMGVSPDYNNPRLVFPPD